MKNICLGIVLFSFLGMYSCSQHDASTNTDSKKKDSIEAAKKKSELLRVADSMNAPEKTMPDSSKSK